MCTRDTAVLWAPGISDLGSSLVHSTSSTACYLGALITVGAFIAMGEGSQGTGDDVH